MRIKILSFLMSILSCFLLVSCGKTTTAKKTLPLKYNETKGENPESFIAADNEEYALKWEKEDRRVVLFDKKNNIQWSYMPSQAMEKRYDADGYEIANHPQIISPISITTFDKTKQVTEKVIGYNSSVKKNSFSISKIANGLSIAFSFEKEEICISVDYILRDDSLLISIDPTKISEGDKCILTSVSIAPFFCSVENKTDNTYLFMPSGCGGIINADVEKADAVDFSEEMYGIGSRRPNESAIKTITTNLTMPVYGAKNNDRALMAIIENGSESASINVNYGNENIGYSSICAVFDVRSHTTLYKNENWGEVQKFSDELTLNTMSVGFYPLYGKDADYSGMARKYREYLESNGMVKSSEEEKMLNLEILGGINNTISVLGIPYDTLYPTTTIEQAEKMVSEIYSATNQSLVVQLCGFGESGLEIGKLAGNLSINKKLGSEKELRNLGKTCSDRDISLYFDYDVLQYKENSSLSSVKNDSARAVNNRNIRLDYYYLWSGTVDSSGKGLNNSSKFTLIKRSLIPDILDKVVATSQRNKLNGISLSTLGRIAYSDNSEQKYYSKGQMPEQINSEILRIKGENQNVLLSSANAYAAQAADYIFDSPMQSSQYDFIDEDIPFYQMVFKGNIPLATPPLTLSGNIEDSVLKAIETGTGLTFALSYDYSNEIVGNSDVRYFGSNYSGMKSKIASIVNDNRDYYSKIKGEKIVNHQIISDEVRCTEFSNGLKVYVNYSDKDVETPLGIVKSKSYIFSETEG